jgi:hypothetical protein
MKKLNIIIIALLNLFLLNTAIPQVADSLNSKSSEFIKNNKFAVIFEFGTIIGRSSMIERYNFLAKYHFSENFAVRAGGDFGVSSSENTSGLLAKYQDFLSYSYGLYADLQYYFLRKSMIKPFVTIGSFYSKDYYYAGRDNMNNLYNRDEWNLGIMSTLGFEVFLINNISLVSEYIAKCYYNSRKDKSINSGSLFYDEKLKDVKFSGNTFRVGFSVYF